MERRGTDEAAQSVQTARSSPNHGYWGDIEALINTLAEQGLEVWDLRAHDGRKAEMNILLPHFFRLRPLLKRTGCRVKVTHRSGFPFLQPVC